MSSLEKRYDFVFLFDVKNGNPNGDPDLGNHPRFDPETRHGLVSDVCIKRKIRNYVDIVNQSKMNCEIYIREKAVLNLLHEEAHKRIHDNKKPNKDEVEDLARADMCTTYYDVRTFGAVMSTGTKKCGQVRGPVQFTFARSIDPILALDQAITRMAVTKEEDRGNERTIGRKYVVPYALYRTHGFISPFLADDTGFSTGDLEILLEALKNMFDHDRSAARGEMNARALIVFEHDSKLGNAPAHKLFDRVSISRKDAGKPARAFSDYEICADFDNLPQGITVRELI